MAFALHETNRKQSNRANNGGVHGIRGEYDGVQAEIRHRELKKLGLQAKIILIGKKGITYFNRRQKEYDIAGDVPSLQHL